MAKKIMSISGSNSERIKLIAQLIEDSGGSVFSISSLKDVLTIWAKVEDDSVERTIHDKISSGSEW